VDAADVVSALPRLESELRRLGAWLLQRDAAGETSAVTRYDVEAEAMLRAWLSREFPEHSFLGEESGNDRRDPAHYWLCDPIDGTSNFTRGLPFWGTSLGYLPQAGIIYFPVLDEMFTAWRGGGAWMNGARIHTSDVRAYSMSTSVALESRSHLWHTLRLRTRVRILGSAIANMCYMARGTFAACRVRGRLWDIGAGVVLLEEAGASVECDPELRAMPPYAYGLPGALAPRLTLDARANADLPPLRQFLQPTPPPD
jgi:myo-inositol-1(or 4)-monophosphatase